MRKAEPRLPYRDWGVVIPGERLQPLVFKTVLTLHVLYILIRLAKVSSAAPKCSGGFLLLPASNPRRSVSAASTAQFNEPLQFRFIFDISACIWDLFPSSLILHM